MLWHALVPDQIQAHLGGGPDGLDAAEAAARLVRHGANRLPVPRRRSLVVIIVGQLRSPLIYLLLLAALVSLLLEEFGQAGFIALVLAINTTIGAVQEWRAEASTAALRKAIRTSARVLRSGMASRIERRSGPGRRGDAGGRGSRASGSPHHQRGRARAG